MIIQHRYSIYVLLLTFSLLGACAPKSTPSEVTEKFWQALQNQNVTTLRKYSIESDPEVFDDIENLPVINNISTGKIVIDGDEANIETKISTQTETGDMELRVITYLEKIDNNWLVDYSATTGPLLVNQDMAEIMDDIQEITEEFTEEIEESVEEIKEKAIPEIKSRMEQAEKEIRKKLPELKNVIEEFLKELEKSIEESIQQPDQEEETTIKT